MQELQHLQALNVDMKGFIRTLLGKASTHPNQSFIAERTPTIPAVLTNTSKTKRSEDRQCVTNQNAQEPLLYRPRHQLSVPKSL